MGQTMHIGTLCRCTINTRLQNQNSKAQEKDVRKHTQQIQMEPVFFIPRATIYKHERQERFKRSPISVVFKQQQQTCISRYIR